MHGKVDIFYSQKITIQTRIKIKLETAIPYFWRGISDRVKLKFKTAFFFFLDVLFIKVGSSVN